MKFNFFKKYIYREFKFLFNNNYFGNLMEGKETPIFLIPCINLMSDFFMIFFYIFKILRLFLK